MNYDAAPSGVARYDGGPRIASGENSYLRLRRNIKHMQAYENRSTNKVRTSLLFFFYSASSRSQAFFSVQLQKKRYPLTSEAVMLNLLYSFYSLRQRLTLICISLFFLSGSGTTYIFL